MDPLTHSPASSLQVLFEGLLATPSTPLPYQADVGLRSFLLQRPASNVIVYNSPALTSSAGDIQDAGGADRLLVNHWHEAMLFGQPGLDVPTFVSERDRGETARSMHIAGTFTGRQMIDDDLEAIPTPGHTAGTTSYLWDNGSHRFLFTGDFIWIEHGEWKAVVIDEGLRGDYLDSLALVHQLDFDVLVPWGTTTGDPFFAIADRVEIHTRIDAITARVEAGGDR